MLSINVFREQVKLGVAVISVNLLVLSGKELELLVSVA
jgi:hypothetical protein